MTPTKRLNDVSQFELLRLIGTGRTSKVFEAKIIETGERVALKICKKASLDPRSRQFVKNERLALMNLRSQSHVVDLKACFQDNLALYFVLDIAETDLDAWIRRLGLIPATSAMIFIAEISLALLNLREAKIVHRDLKPNNVLIKSDRHVLLSDFGGCHFVSDSPKEAKKEEISGSLYYMPPEVAVDMNVDPEEQEEVQLLLDSKLIKTSWTAQELKLKEYAFDLWSLGCLTFQMLTGQIPFKADTQEDLIYYIILNKPDLTLIASNEFRHLVSSLLQTDPRLRLGFENPRDILDHPALNSLGHDAVSSSYVPTLLEAASELSRQNGIPLWEFTPDIGRSFRCVEIGRQMPTEN